MDKARYLITSEFAKGKLMMEDAKNDLKLLPNCEEVHWILWRTDVDLIRQIYFTNLCLASRKILKKSVFVKLRIF